MPSPKKKPTTPTPRRRSESLPTPVDSHKHADKRANIPTEELRGFGRWAFLEIVNPWDAKNMIRALLKGESVDGDMPMFKGIIK